MVRAYCKLLVLSWVFSEMVVAKSMIDCRVATGSITQCNPYGAKLLRAKEVVYDVSSQKLIRVKTLPLPEKKPSLKVISVADMIEKYVKVEDSMRFKGSKTAPLHIQVIKKSLDLEKVEEKIEEIKSTPVIEQETLEKIYQESPDVIEGKYTVAKGDMLSTIARKLEMSSKTLAEYNRLTLKSTLRVGQVLKIPMEQKMIDALSSASYKVEEGDTLLSIAKMFNLDPKLLVTFNKIKSSTTIVTGKTLKLPLLYVLKNIEAEKKAEAKKRAEAKKKKRRKRHGRVDMVHGFGKRKLRVTATAYSSHRGQTDRTPFLAAWNNRLRPGMKVIAVSRDMLTRYGMKNGTRVRIGGLRGTYRVRDKMNKRYKKRIDIYMGTNRRKALRWGRRSVVIYW